MSGIKIPEMYYFKLLQEDGSFYYQNGIGTEKETNNILHLEYSFIWC
jgi:hypothetical protein